MGAANEQEPVRWYVLRVTLSREIIIRNDLRRSGFDCYLPMTYKIIQTGKQKLRRLVPAIYGMVFVHCTKSAIDSYIKETAYPIFLMGNGRKGHREVIVVDDQDMENFIRFTQHTEQNLTYFHPDEIKLNVGDKIKVIGGIFDGIEGVLVRVPGKRGKQLVVSIPEISAVAVSLSPEMVQLVDQPAVKSVDIDGDIKSLYQLAYEKLFAAPDPVQYANEHNILMSELRRTLQRLEPVKGYTAQRQAELALPIYMATKALKLNADEATQRLFSAVNTLKATSLLRLRLQLYYALLNPDAELMESIKARVEEWKKAPLSNQQRLLKEELSQLLNLSCMV